MSDVESVTWVLEAEVFPDTHARMRDSILAAHHEVVLWKDDWLTDESWPRLDGRRVVFHGSLGNAAQLAASAAWTPGAFCDTAAFHCSRWYAGTAQWLLHERWLLTTVGELAADPGGVLAPLGSPVEVFVRPDGPLKAFSGRVLQRDQITLAAIDHGFYYDDERLPVVIAPVQKVTREWRYVVVDREVVAGSAYAADGRSPLPDDRGGKPWSFASEVAQGIALPQDVLVLDICEVAGRLRLLELNPFSGADLYACERADVVRSVSAFAVGGRLSPARSSSVTQ